MPATHSSRRILLPVKRWFIFVSLIAAMFLDMIPLGQLPFVPDWVALTLAFWCIREPRKVGMGSAFLLGIAMDVADASVMGQHPLAYVALAFAANALSRRILWFPLQQQALHVLALLLATQLVMLVARMMGGGDYPGHLYLLSSIIAAALWHPMTYMLLLPQYRATERDDTRPI
jgi:rod shape-determining protein MreD